MKKIISFFILLFLAFNVGATAELVATWNAENGVVGAKPPAPLTAVTGPNIPLIAGSPVFSGTKAYDVYLNKNQPTILGAKQNPYRTEMRGGVNFEFEREYWIGVAFYRTIWDYDTSGESWPIQVHEAPSSWTNWGTSPCTQSATATAPIFFSNSRGNMSFRNLNNTLWTKPIDIGVWHTMIIHMKLSKGTTGFIESWYDGVEQPRYPATGTRQTHRADSAMHAFCGPNSSATGDVTFVPPLFATGVYKWDWNPTKLQPSLTTIRQGRLDAMKVVQDIAGNDDAAAFAMVNPGSVGGGGGDTTPPVISNVQVGSITNDSATITWTTNESSDSTVTYGKTSALGSTAIGPSGVTTHSTVVSGLEPGTLYYAKVASKDAANNTAIIATPITFTTTSADITPPVVSNIHSNISDSSATIDWSTNEPATSRVKIWWPENTAGVAQYFPELVTNHSITFTGLTPAKTYDAKITSVDAFNNVNDLNVFQFTTNDVVAQPVISNISINITDTQATVSFETQVAATGFVDYGLTRSYGSTEGSETLTQLHTLILPNLTPNKVYHWRIRTANNNGLAAESIRMSFYTLSPSGMKSDGFN